jgi:hypothetical protein
MAKKKASEKERKIESFSKEALVSYLKNHVVFVDLFRLAAIDSDIQWKKLDEEMSRNRSESEVALNAKDFVKYYKLRSEWERLSKKQHRLIKWL